MARHHWRARLCRALGRPLAACGLAALGALAFVVHPASASVSAPCSATAYESSQKASPAQAKAGQGQVLSTFDVTTQSDWTVGKDSYVGGSGESTVPMKTADVNVAAFGFSVNIVHASGNGGTVGSAGPYHVSDWAKDVARVHVTGGASGDNGSCSGSFAIKINESAVTTAAGGGGLGLGVLCALGLVLLAVRSVPVSPAPGPLS